MNVAAETKKEFSAGGVIIEDGKTLLIRMRNLKGELVWTFPKGHVEAGETPELAALREVTEETGCRCRITGELMTARYNFTRGSCPVDKEVRWFLMERSDKDCAPTTPEEICGLEWCDAARAAQRLQYPSDRELFELIKNRL